MSADQFIETFDQTVPVSPEGALPVITFTESVTFHWNGDELHVFHVAPAHTDGDAIIHFRKANVVHMGDTYFNGMYPFIDVSSGGSIDGMLSAVEAVLALADDRIKIIPGHGPLSGVAELREYRRVLSAVRERVAQMVKQGRTRDEVIAARPSREFDATWGGGFLKPDQWVGLVYDGLVK